jgi:DNA-directed RNA polymerase specialized sigma subunit
MEWGLSQLITEEQTILELEFLHDLTPQAISFRIHKVTRQVYRIRKSALNKLAQCLYGVGCQKYVTHNSAFRDTIK